MATGLMVVLDGCDGAGKATQSKILAERLGAKLYSFPRYDTLIGKTIKRHLRNEVELRERVETITVIEAGIDRIAARTRTAPEDPLMFQTLMVADKLDASWDIEHELLRGTSVVCDRWIPSAICYGAADGVDKEWLVCVHALLPQADLNIFLDVSPEEAIRRRPQARDRYERDREKQERVRGQYRQLWADEAGAHYVTVNGDGGGGPGSIDVVSERIWAAVETYRREHP